jgi:hypothetical protein
LLRSVSTSQLAPSSISSFSGAAPGWAIVPKTADAPNVRIASWAASPPSARPIQVQSPEACSTWRS